MTTTVLATKNFTTDTSLTENTMQNTHSSPASVRHHSREKGKGFL